ncbi:C6 transcription factor [Histoplasma capsulatum]|uniref:C6 transcription factor n=1 Tax=Ajellomyces capsulatus TaxID=5037 RepID=A0A8A1LXF6_AJECA|nr:C6 transcription factor [Histoplasma capsulatum]
MSGSPSPESRFDPLLRDRRRRGSDSPIPSPVRGNVQPLLSYAEPPAIAPGPDAPLPDSRRLSAGQPAMSVIGLPAIDDTQLRHTLQTGPLLPPRASPLPPRSTRRAKAHVASACVNCKRKHLGCDSARPCRRCISAGKEESCVDVRHKRRGRPPLKAEEGTIQTYEPTYSYPGASHPQPESSSPVPPFYGHRRTSSSREIRPNTELQVSRRSSEIGNPYILSLVKGYRRISLLANINDPISPRFLGGLPISRGRDLRTARCQVPPYRLPAVRGIIRSRALANPKYSYRLLCRQKRGQILSLSFLRAVNDHLEHFHHPCRQYSQGGRTLAVLNMQKSWKTPDLFQHTLPFSLPLFPPGRLFVAYWIHIAPYQCLHSRCHMEKPLHRGN